MSTFRYSIEHYRKYFIREFQNKVTWEKISQYQILSVDFIREFQNEVHWFIIGNYQVLSEDFIEEFQNKMTWILIFKCQFLSEEFIEKHNYVISSKYILQNKKYKYFSTRFIKKYKPKFNKFYKYNHAANIIRNSWLKKYYKPGNLGHQNEIAKFENEFV